MEQPGIEPSNKAGDQMAASEPCQTTCPFPGEEFASFSTAFHRTSPADLIYNPLSRPCGVVVLYPAHIRRGRRRSPS